MDLTERERRILAELESQLSAGPMPSGPDQFAPLRWRALRPRWTVLPSAVLGILLLASGLVLGVGSAVAAGALLVLWWLCPWLPRAGRLLMRVLAADVPQVPPTP